MRHGSLSDCDVYLLRVGGLRYGNSKTQLPFGLAGGAKLYDEFLQVNGPSLCLKSDAGLQGAGTLEQQPPF